MGICICGRVEELVDDLRYRFGLLVDARGVQAKVLVSGITTTFTIGTWRRSC